MNIPGLALAALGGTFASFVVGALIFWLAPGLVKEAHRYPAVYRPQDALMARMPLALASTYLAVLAAAVLYSMVRPGSSPAADGARFGALLGLFVVCASALHNYVNLNIGLKLALGQAAAHFAQWLAVGVAVALIYRPLPAL